MSIELIHGDCMDYMRGLPDNAFELAIVDGVNYYMLYFGVSIARYRYEIIKRTSDRKGWRILNMC